MKGVSQWKYNSNSTKVYLGHDSFFLSYMHMDMAI